MKQITIKAPAKINLFLNITGVRPDGYHDLQTVMQAVDLYDTVTVSLTSSPGIILSCGPGAPSDESNIAWRCAGALLDYINRPDTSLHITVEKQIPMQAGLGGGSADGAAVLAALNYLLESKLPLTELTGIGKTMGADIPFCLLGSAAFAEGIGEKLTVTDPVPPCSLAVVKPPFGISTKEAFSRFDRAEVSLNSPTADSLLQALQHRDLTAVGNSMFNLLECCCGDSRIETIKQALLSRGALGALMTGSGSAVFGIFENDAQAGNAIRSMDKNLGAFYLCHPVTHGPVIWRK